MSDDKKKPDELPAVVPTPEEPDGAVVKKDAEDWETLDPEVQGRILFGEQNSFNDSWTIFVAGGPKG